MAVIQPTAAAQTLKSGLGEAFRLEGAPVNGASGSFVNLAQPGSLLVRIDGGAAQKLYINTNTSASPTWVVVGTQT
jgi:hypothetical protein